MKMRILPLLSLPLALGACGLLPGFDRAPTGSDGGLRPSEVIAPAVSTTPLGAQGYRPEALDRTSAAEKAAALTAPVAGGERALGQVVVALGPPAESGLWVQSALISQKGQGRVIAPNGQSLAVELRPGQGGALLSFSAYQALGIGLTELPQITIWGK